MWEHRPPGVPLDLLLGGVLGAVVAEPGPVHPDDGDVDQVHARIERCHQAPSAMHVDVLRAPVGAGCGVDYDIDAVHRRRETVAGAQIERDPTFPSGAARRADRVSPPPELGDQQRSEAPAGAGDEDGGHGGSLPQAHRQPPRR